ncbi:MAG: TPR end-of-group domain-containing protein [Leptolyngbyaceae cyanobacterium]
MLYCLQSASDRQASRVCHTLKYLILLKQLNSYVIPSLQTAISLNSKYKTLAITDSDFDSIRQDDRFQALIAGSDSG